MQLDVSETQTELLTLLEAVERGEKVVIARDGQPVVQLVAVRTRQLGAFPRHIKSNLLEPTDLEIIASFYES
jgi:antitoxin (DNA-binding transcriptional repressor) of toxin-antitoxin stability system